jgi:hypothetical protein
VSNEIPTIKELRQMLAENQAALVTIRRTMARLRAEINKPEKPTRRHKK